MKLFKELRLKWWQAGLFKLGLLTLGIAIGAFWHEYFHNYIFVLIIIAAGCLAYITHIWWKQ